MPVHVTTQICQASGSWAPYSGPPAIAVAVAVCSLLSPAPAQATDSDGVKVSRTFTCLTAYGPTGKVTHRSVLVKKFMTPVDELGQPTGEPTTSDLTRYRYKDYPRKWEKHCT